MHACGWDHGFAQSQITHTAALLVPHAGHTMGQSAQVRFASKADIRVRSRHVRFTPKSGHRRRQEAILLRSDDIIE
jgi:hypothetical protein